MRGVRPSPPTRHPSDGYLDHKARMGAHHAKNGAAYFAAFVLVMLVITFVEVIVKAL